MTVRLPEHAAEVMAIVAEAEDCSQVFWHVEPDGMITLLALCSDTFDWGTADAERIEADDLPAFRQAWEDLRPYDDGHLVGVLFTARKRGRRPMELWLYGRDPARGGAPHKDAVQLFEAAGPAQDRYRNS